MASTALVAGITLSGQVLAQQAWDPGATDGTIVGGTGTWAAGTPNWTSDAGTTNEVWTGGGDAVFGGTAGTVTVSGTQIADSLLFNSDGYVVTGGAITYGNSSPGISVVTGTTTIASDITAASGINKVGAGELVLSGANTVSGYVNVGGGLLTLGSANAVNGTAGIVVQNVSGQAKADLGGYTISTTHLIVNGLGNTSLDNGTYTFTGLAQLGLGTINAVLAGTGTFQKTANYTGTLTAQNTMTGPVNNVGGTLVISATGGINNVMAINNQGTLNVDGGGNNAIGDAAVIDNTGTFILTGSDETIGSITGAGNIEIANGTNLTLADGTTHSISGGISGAGGLTVNKTGGTVTLSGTNTHSGATTLAAGGLTLSGGSAIADTGAVVVNGGMLRVNGLETIGALSGTGGMIDVSFAGLTTNGTGAATEYAGAVTAAGFGAFTKGGTDALTLSGVVSGTSIGVSAGTLTLSNAANTPQAIILQAGTRLNLATTGAGGTAGISLGGDSAIGLSDTVINDQTISPSIAGQSRALTMDVANGTATQSGAVSVGPAGSLSKTGAGTLNLTTANHQVATLNTNAGTTNLTAGSVTSAAVNGGDLIVGGTASGLTTATINDGTLTLNAGVGSLTSITVGDGTPPTAGNEDRLVIGTALGAGTTITTQGSVIDYNANSAAPIVLGSDTTQLEVTTAGESFTQSGIISETGGARPIEKIGNGELILSEDNSYTGATMVSAGRLNVTGNIDSTVISVATGAGLTVDGSAIADTAAITLNGGADLTLTGSEIIGSLSATGASSTIKLAANALTFGDGTDTTIAGTISGSGAVTKLGSGTVTLSGASVGNSGALNVNGGTINLTGIIGSTPVTVNTGGALNVTAGGLTTGAAVTVAGGALDVSTTDDTVTSVVLNGNGTISGDATLNTSTFSQTTGILSGTVSAGTTATLAGGTISGMLTGAGATTATGGITNLTGTGSISTASLAINTGASVNETGTGRISTTGNLIDINGGTLTTNGGDGIADNEAINMSAGTFTLTGDETIGALNGAGTTNLTNSALTVVGNFATVYSGIIQGNGGLNVSGNNMLTLLGANTYTGDTAVNNTAEMVVSGSIDSATITINDTGALTLTNGDALLDTAAVVLNTNGRLTLNNAGETIGSLTGAAGSMAALAGTLSVGDATPIITMAGTISGAGGITKNGAGTLILTGANTYNGDTRVNDGTVSINNDAALGGNTSKNVILAGGTLLSTANITLDVAQIASDGTNAVNTIAAADGTTLTVNGNINFQGPMSQLRFGDTGLGGIVVAMKGSTTPIFADARIENGTLRIGSAAAGSGLLSDISGTTFDVNGTLDMNGQTVVIKNLLGNNGTINSSAGAAMLQTTGTSIYGGVIENGAGTSALTIGNGTLTLTGANTYTGATNVSGGNLTLTSTGSIESTAISIAGGRTLTAQGNSFEAAATIANDGRFVVTADEIVGSLSGAGAVSVTGATLTTGGLNTPVETMSGVVSGTGMLLKTGTGTLTLSANNTVDTLIVENGTLLVSGDNTGVNTVTVGGGIGDARLRLANDFGAGGAAGTITTLGSVVSYADGINIATPIVLNSNDTQLDVLGADAATQSGVISETGGARPIEKIGSGTLTLAGANTYTGATTVSAGTLNVTGSIASGAVMIAAGTTLTTAGGALTNTPDVTNNGQVSLNGSETLGSLNGAGQLALNGAATDLTLTAGNSAITTAIAGAGGLNITGTSATTLSGANTYSGGTTISGGSLTIAAGGTLGAATGTTMISGGALTVNTDTTQFDVIQSGGTIDGSAILTATNSFTHLGVTVASEVTTPVFAMTSGQITATGRVNAANTASLTGTNQIDGTLNGGGTGTTAITGGATTLGASGIITDMATLNVNAGATLSSAGTVGTSGGLTNGGMLNLAGTANTSITNNDTFNLSGALMSGGFDVANSGTLNFGANAFTGVGAFGNSGNVNIQAGTLSATSLTNSGTFNAAGSTIALSAPTGLSNTAGTFDLTGGQMNSSVQNAAAFILDGGSVAGAFTNTGTLSAKGTSTLAALTSTDGSVDMRNGTTIDQLTINGDLTGGTFQMNTNLKTAGAANPTGGTSDRITVTGATTGQLKFAFTDVGPADGAPYIGAPVTVFDGTNSSYDFTYAGLPTGGAVVYALGVAGDDLQISATASSGVGNLVASAFAIQNLSGPITTLGSGGFGNGVETPSGCFQGGSARAIAGQANSSADNTTFDSTYRGVQGSWDYTCNDGRLLNGWDVGVNVFAGAITGTSQFDVTGAGPSTFSQTSTAFDQIYGGISTRLRNGPLVADLQIRADDTSFTLNETVAASASGLGLNDANFSMSSTNLAGRLGYKLDVGATGATFTPSVGLSMTRTGATNLTFSGGETLRMGAHDALVGSVGGRYETTNLSVDGDSTTSVIADGHYFADFSDDRTSIFSDTRGGQEIITTSPFGNYAKISLGLNHTRTLQSGSTLNTSIGANVQMGDNSARNVGVSAGVSLSF